MDRVQVTERVVSLSTKIKQITGLAGTISVDAETNRFLEALETATDDGRDTRGLTKREVAWIERIFEEHFA